MHSIQHIYGRWVNCRSISSKCLFATIAKSTGSKRHGFRPIFRALLCTTCCNAVPLLAQCQIASHRRWRSDAPPPFLPSSSSILPPLLPTRAELLPAATKNSRELNDDGDDDDAAEGLSDWLDGGGGRGVGSWRPFGLTKP